MLPEIVAAARAMSTTELALVVGAVAQAVAEREGKEKASSMFRAAADAMAAPPPALALPVHKASLSLTHNEHRDCYEKLEDWLANRDRLGAEPDWESPEARQRAIDTDECWVLHWYPNSPVGFNEVAAPTLEECLRLAGAE